MTRDGGVVAVTSIALEARIARGEGVTVLCHRTPQLTAALEAVIAHASGVISFGICGGLAPGLVAGDCIVAAGVRCGKEFIATDAAWTHRLLTAIPEAIHAELAGSDVLVMDPREKARLHARTAAVAVDMESHVAGRIAAAHRKPFAVCRVIIDSAERALPPATAVGLHEDGTPDLRAVLGSLLRQPSQLPDLIRTARDVHVAERALGWARARLGPGLGFAEGSPALARDRAVA